MFNNYLGLYYNLKSNPYNLREKQLLKLNNIRTKTYGLSTATLKNAVICNNLTNYVKEAKLLQCIHVLLVSCRKDIYIYIIYIYYIYIYIYLYIYILYKYLYIHIIYILIYIYYILYTYIYIYILWIAF